MQESTQAQSPNESVVLTPQESKILSLIRSRKYKAINIRFREDSPLVLELTEQHDLKSRMIDLLRQNPYQNLMVKTHQGRISHIEQTTKLILE